MCGPGSKVSGYKGTWHVASLWLVSGAIRPQCWWRPPPSGKRKQGAASEGAACRDDDAPDALTWINRAHLSGQRGLTVAGIRCRVAPVLTAGAIIREAQAGGRLEGRCAQG